ncbi:hypothetical protein VOLCADRAFT_100944 [Volvox carteri f. nagariensis]|uniref:Anaphase-promoting complex subunit 5 n=1 Tax=Volvox carteri f. nagariensis TaxID=3068 RepID=D8ULD9_VOLCA|nr:uncharacterized protein VOLCADRAFT_100944 [Volvox carteri f. nagariensis]EFJ39461.1 hypothetical protein VOLCADRAFT_100944 [Volvox carteri f. nagariensis]|eukprot:XP_002959475.1 hypothetical protein VOLCADRAFT_100944 [Volvox carteri f. nagariensis]
MHAGLGHTAEALHALNETMRLAQQCGDPVVLLHALSVLCRLLAAIAPGAPGLPPHGPAALRSSLAHHVQLLRMLRRCRERGRELGQPHLTAFAQLAAARFAMLHDVEPSDSGLHAPPGSLTAAAAAAAVPPSAGAAPAEAPAGAGGEGELRAAPLMVSCAVRDTHALATAASLSAAAPAAPPPTAADGTPPPPQRAAAAASDLYSSPLLFDRSLPIGAAAAMADAVQQLAGAAHLLQSAAWALHGHNTLERAHTMMYLAAFSDPQVGCGTPARFEDRSTACAQLVAAVARRGPAAARAAAAACLGLLAASVCCDGTEDSSPSYSESSAGGGAATAVTAAAAEGSTKASGGWDGGCNALALWGGPALAAAWLCAVHDRALALGDSAAAAQLVGQLCALSDPQAHRDVEIRLEAARRGVLNLLAAGATEEAHRAATELFARCADAGLQAPALRCLMLLAEVHLAAGDPHGAFLHVLACLLPAQPGPGPAGGGVFAAAAAGAAADSSSLGAAVAGGGSGGGRGGRSHDLLAAEALVLLCRVWYELSDGQQLEEVLVLLQDALPLILAHGSVHLQARAQLVLAEMVMSEASSPADLTHCYSQLQRLLAGAAQAATAAEDFRMAAQAACMLAWLHHSQGSVSERDTAAALQETLLDRQAEAEAACASEGRTLHVLRA